MKTTSFLAAVAIAGAMTTSAMAADMAVPYTDPGFDWDGFYAGLGGTAQLWGGTPVGGIDAIIGYNVTSDKLLFGLEGSFGVVGFGGGFGIQSAAEGRIGYLVSPDALIYSSAGVEYFSAAGVNANLGGGVEFAVSDDLSIDFEYQATLPFAPVVIAHRIDASLNWHFN